MAERNVLSGDYEMAIARLDEAQPIISREIDDPTLACRVELTWATLWRHRGDLELAQSHVEHALAWAAGLKGWRTTLDPSLVQAEVAFDSGDTDRALDSIGVSLDQAREANHSQRLTRALCCSKRASSRRSATSRALRRRLPRPRRFSGSRLTTWFLRSSMASGDRSRS